MPNQVIGRTRRNGWKQLVGTVIVMLSLLAGLLAQSRQAKAQVSGFPSMTPTPSPSIGLPDTDPIPEDMWDDTGTIPIYPVAVTPPTAKQIVAAVQACIKQLGKNATNAQYAACLLRKLGKNTVANNCNLIVAIFHPEYFPSGTDPCTNGIDCQHCGDVVYFCCLLTGGAAANCYEKQKAKYLLCLTEG